MGETGCGLVDASAIIGGTPLATKWQEVEAVCPWFFLLRDLCGAGRPNVSESARANSTTELNVNSLRSRRGRNRDDESSEDEERSNGEDQDDEDEEDNEDEDDGEEKGAAEATGRHSSPAITQAPAPPTPARQSSQSQRKRQPEKGAAQATGRHSSPTVTQAPAPRTPARQSSQSQRKRQPESSPAPQRLPKKQKEKRTLTVSDSG
jgi:hypothetical protein